MKQTLFTMSSEHRDTGTQAHRHKWSLIKAHEAKDANRNNRARYSFYFLFYDLVQVSFVLLLCSWPRFIRHIHGMFVCFFISFSLSFTVSHSLWIRFSILSRRQQQRSISKEINIKLYYWPLTGLGGHISIILPYVIIELTKKTKNKKTKNQIKY